MIAWLVLLVFFLCCPPARVAALYLVVGVRLAWLLWQLDELGAELVKASGRAL